MKSPLFRTGLLVSMLAAAHAASAQNLVTNPGFETGNLNGYTLTGNTSLTGIAMNGHVLGAHTGFYAGYFGDAGTPGGIAQSIATIPGAAYVVSFYVRSGGGPSDPNDSFVASFGGASLALGDLPLTYAPYGFTTVATSSSTLLGFSARNDRGNYLLDDISVTPVPEPSALAALGLGAGALIRRRKRA